MRHQRLLPALVLTLLAVALSLGQTMPVSARGLEQALAGSVGPARITIPSIELDSEVMPVGYQLTGGDVGWQTAENAVGWHRSSAMPGSPGNTVMSGHNGTLGSGVFRNLRKVKIGDAITVTVNGKDVNYAVTNRVIFRHMFVSEKRQAENAAWLGYFGDERLTLITCHPWYTSTHRLVVVAHPVEARHLNVWERIR